MVLDTKGAIMAGRTVRVGEMANIMGVTPQTIRKWADNGQIPSHHTPAGQRIFTPEDIRKALGDNQQQATSQHWAYYLRSNQSRTTSLQHQQEQLTLAYPEPDYIIQDKASGLNENRKGLNRLMQLAQDGHITDIAITTQDRLTRFGYKYLQKYFETYHITIHILGKPDKKTAEQELMDDFMALTASFSGRFYQQRNKQNMRRLLQTAEQGLDSKEQS